MTQFHPVQFHSQISKLCTQHGLGPPHMAQAPQHSEGPVHVQTASSKYVWPKKKKSNFDFF